MSYHTRLVPWRERLMNSLVPEPNSGCWLWLGHSPNNRYGVITIDGVAVLTHRAMWMMTHGDIPADLSVCHKCDVGFCCNPDHLFLGTHQENMDDRGRKSRHWSHRGEMAGQAKLTEEQALHILRDSRSYSTIASEYGISIAAIGHLKSGRNWKHLHVA